MKKILFITVLIALASVIYIGCSVFGTVTYVFDKSDSSGICVEVTTSDSEIKNAAELSGYVIGTCPTDDRLGTCANYTELEGETFSAYFYSDGTSELDAASAEELCTQISGTWTAE